MDQREKIIVILSILLTISLTLQISGGIQRAGGVVPYIAGVFGSLGGEIAN